MHRSPCSKAVPALRPAQACLLCGVAHSDVGGCRLVATTSQGTRLSPKPIGGGHRDFRTCVPLGKDRKGNLGQNGYLVVWGEASRFTSEAIERARQVYLSGHRPWLCQPCGYRVCSDCGAPLRRPIGADYILDDGEILHSPVLGVDPGCVNADCHRYRDSRLNRVGV